jgi:hypothetical protein
MIIAFISNKPAFIRDDFDLNSRKISCGFLAFPSTKMFSLLKTKITGAKEFFKS